MLSPASLSKATLARRRDRKGKTFCRARSPRVPSPRGVVLFAPAHLARYQRCRATLLANCWFQKPASIRGRDEGYKLPGLRWQATEQLRVEDLDPNITPRGEEAPTVGRYAARECRIDEPAHPAGLEVQGEKGTAGVAQRRIRLRDEQRHTPGLPNRFIQPIIAFDADPGFRYDQRARRRGPFP